MCKNFLENGNCKIRMPNDDGSRDVKASAKIRQAFQDTAQNSPNYKDAKLGVGCGGYQCCFSSGKFATWTDCPYYVV